MATLQELWSNYWWVIPVALFALCILGCILGSRCCAHACPCMRYPGEDRPEQPPTK